MNEYISRRKAGIKGDMISARSVRYGKKIEESRDINIEEFISKMEEHYDPDELRRSFQRMTEYFE